MNRFLENSPLTFNQMQQLVSDEFFHQACAWAKEHTKKEPVLNFSQCSWARGWNVKFSKGSKSLFMLYPQFEPFKMQVIIGKNEVERAREILQSCDVTIQDFYYKNVAVDGTCWVMVEVKNERILHDLFRLAELRLK